MRSLICDDDQTVLSELKNVISAFFKDADLSHAVESFVDPSAFLASARSVVPDIAFIDLVIGDVDGYAVAAEIRKISLETEIVFITSFSGKMPDAFAYKPIAFLEKPVRAEAVSDVLKTVMAYHWHKGLSYTVRVKGEWRRIQHKSIEYFESREHRIIVHLTDGGAPVVFPGRLDDVEADLKGMPYARCHKSYIVQISAIRSLDRVNPGFYTNAGARVPISRKYYHRATREFIEYKLT